MSPVIKYSDYRAVCGFEGCNWCALDIETTWADANYVLKQHERTCEYRDGNKKTPLVVDFSKLKKVNIVDLKPSKKATFGGVSNED